MSATALFDALPKTILWLLPTPLTTFWSAGDMKRHGINMNLVQMNGLIPSTFQVILILGIMAGISILLIDCLYKKRGNKIEDYCKNRIIEIKTLSYYMGGDSSYATLCSIDTFYFYG